MRRASAKCQDRWCGPWVPKWRTQASRLRRSASSQELRAFCREHLAHFKTPHSFTTVDELPKTGTGKIDRQKLLGGAGGGDA